MLTDNSSMKFSMAELQHHIRPRDSPKSKCLCLPCV